MISYRNSKCARLQTLSLTCTTRRNTHKFFILCLGCFRVSLAISSFYIFNDTFKCNIIEALPALSEIMHIYIFTICAVNQYILNLLRIFLKWCIQRKMIFFRKCFQYSSGEASFLAGRLPSHNRNRTLINAQTLIRNDQICVKFHLISESRALRACSKRIIK